MTNRANFQESCWFNFMESLCNYEKTRVKRLPVLIFLIISFYFLMETNKEEFTEYFNRSGHINLATNNTIDCLDLNFSFKIYSTN